MRARSKWIWAGIGAFLIAATLTYAGLWPVLPASAVKLCEAAFDSGTYGDNPALTQTAQLVKQPGMVAMMKADLALNKRDPLRFASVAYVLGMNGIDPKENAHRLRVMVSFSPKDSLWERLSYLTDPAADDNTVDVIPERALDICNKYPRPDVLRGVLSMQWGGGGPEFDYVTSFDDLFVNHPNEVLAAIAGRPDLEDDVAMALGGSAEGDPRLPPIVNRECRSPSIHIRSAAVYVKSAMKRWTT